ERQRGSRSYKMAKKHPPDGAASGTGNKIEVVILAGNVALVGAPADHPALMGECGPFRLALPPGQEQAVAGPTTAFPAGLVPRLKAALESAGRRVSVTDRRQFQAEDGFRIDGAYVRRAEGGYSEEAPLLRAAAANPLGQVEYRS